MHVIRPSVKNSIKCEVSIGSLSYGVHPVKYHDITDLYRIDENGELNVNNSISIITNYGAKFKYSTYLIITISGLVVYCPIRQPLSHMVIGESSNRF